MSEQTLNSRTTVLFSEKDGLRINRKDMTVLESIEVVQRTLLHLRMRQGGLNVLNYIDSFEHFPDEPVDDMKICLAWNPEIEKIQVAITGVSILGACQILEYAVSYFHTYLISPEVLTHAE